MDSSDNTSSATSIGLLKSVAWMDVFRNQGATIFFVGLIVSSLFIPVVETTLVQAFPVMLVALGMTLVISSGGIDISVGAIMAISAAVSAKLYISGVGWAPSVNFGIVAAASFGCGIVAAALCGLFNGILISRFRIQPIIVTLVVMIAGRGLASRIQGQPVESTPFGEFGLYRIAGKVPVQIPIMAVLVAIMLFLVKKTVFAKHVEAIGNNSRAARLVGINIVTTTIGVYVVCGILCAIAGNMEAALRGTVNVVQLGVLVELDAIAAVAIGGTPFSGGRARIMGTVVGVVVVALVPVIVAMSNMPADYSLVFKALIVVVAMWAQRKR